MSPSEDERLVARALASDRSAQRQLAGRLLGSIQREVVFSVKRHAAGTGRDPRQEVRDLVQDVLVALFEHDGRELRRWEPGRGRNLDSFVRLVARRRVARTLGQRRGNPWATVPVAPEHLEGDDDAALLRRLDDRQTLDTLLEALYAKMSDRDHELFDLLYVQQLDPAEVAKTLDMSRGAINAWSYRLRKQARALLETSELGMSSSGGTQARGTVDDGR